MMIAVFSGGELDGQEIPLSPQPGTEIPPFTLRYQVPVLEDIVAAADRDPLRLMQTRTLVYTLERIIRFDYPADVEPTIRLLYGLGERARPAGWHPAPEVIFGNQVGPGGGGGGGDTSFGNMVAASGGSGGGGDWLGPDQAYGPQEFRGKVEPCGTCGHYAAHEMIGGRPWCDTCAGDCRRPGLEEDSGWASSCRIAATVSRARSSWKASSRR